MAMIMHQQDEIRRNRSSQSERDFSFWVSRNRAYLALQASSLLFFLFILLSLRMEFSVFSISFFSFNLGRTHMFILCNGIVAILVKGSVLAESHEDGEEAKKKMKNVEGIQKNDEISVEKLVEIEKTIVGIKEEEEEEDEKIVGGCVLVAEIEQIDLQLVEEEEERKEEEEEEEDGFEELSVEELNKKCDEFIRRMRGVISNGNSSL